jgi:hypothetical protein
MTDIIRWEFKNSVDFIKLFTNIVKDLFSINEHTAPVKTTYELLTYGYVKEGYIHDHYDVEFNLEGYGTNCRSPDQIEFDPEYWKTMMERFHPSFFIFSNIKYFYVLPFEHGFITMAEHSSDGRRQLAIQHSDATELIRLKLIY